jgi:hypothetical protein
MPLISVEKSTEAQQATVIPSSEFSEECQKLKDAKTRRENKAGTSNHPSRRRRRSKNLVRRIPLMIPKSISSRVLVV